MSIALLCFSDSVRVFYMLATLAKPTSVRSFLESKRKHPARRVISEDRLEDYSDPQEVKRSLERALEDVRRGRVHAKL